METVTRLLDELGIDHYAVEHPPVYTVADVALHMPDKFPVKNLLLKEEKGDRCIFVIMKGDERLDTKRLQHQLGCRKLQFAKPDVLMQKLGVEPGSASLFSLMHHGSKDLDVVIDQRLLEQTKVGFHPSENTKTIFIQGDQIRKVLDKLSASYLVIQM